MIALRVKKLVIPYSFCMVITAKALIEFESVIATATAESLFIELNNL